MLPPIADYALIGDTRTAALCSKAGSIDWLCLPRFDSDPVFSRLIDDTGPHFRIRPLEPGEAARRYVGSSTMLETTWRTAGGVLSLSEGLVSDLENGLLPQVLLVRRLHCISGQSEVEVVFDLRPGLPARDCRWQRRQQSIVMTHQGLAVALRTSPDLELEPGKGTTITLSAGQEVIFALSVAQHEPLVLFEPARAWRLLERTRDWWENWAAEIEYEGSARDAVVRSLITLRLLTYSPSGAPVASPTMALPERIGADRNWDYRYAWPRDASIGLGAFLGAGKRREAEVFLAWLTHASRLTRPRLGVMYTLDGRPAPDEREIQGMSGYHDSRPLRRGNEAGRQHQLDVYGWVIDAASRLAANGGVEGGAMAMVADFADYVCSNWRRPDAGIWERRNDNRHWVHSKLMAWLALDRAVSLHAGRRGKAKVRRWEAEKQAIARDVVAEGWDDSRQSYRRSYGSGDLDAAVVSPVLFAFDNDRRRLEGTVKAIREKLTAGGPLLYRYRRTAGDEEGAFLPCSFWLVQALARLGRVDEAGSVFEETCGLANDVGLLPEEIDPADGAFLGNFPLAFSHATLVNAALDLRQANQK
jgi:GH15 family glucan-1,4-alpha-glucosidase